MSSDTDSIVDQEEFVWKEHCQGWQKYVKTSILVFSWICLGLYSEILGPTLPTLMYQTNSNYEQIGSALAVRSAGLLSGSLVGGWTSDKFVQFRPVQMCIALFIAATVNFVIPLARSLPLLSFLFYLSGCAHGVLTTNGNPLLASIWQSEASGPFSLMHAGYGIGGAVAPALVAPFTKVNQSHDPSTAALYTNNSADPVIVDPRFPYSIVGITLLACSMCFLTFDGILCDFCRQLRRSGKKRTTRNKSLHPNATSPTRHSLRSVYSLWYRFLDSLRMLKRRATRDVVFISIAVFVIYFAIVGNERVFGKFMFTYAIAGPVRMKPDKGYLINLLYWLCFGLARVITSLLALIFSAESLLLCEVFGTVLASGGLAMMPPKESWFFLMTCLFGLFKSPLFPITLATINRSYEINGFIVLMVNFGSAAGASLMQYAAGLLVETFGQSVFPFLVTTTAGVVLLTAFLLLFLLRRVGDRFSRNVPAEPVVVRNPAVPSRKSESFPLGRNVGQV